MAVLSVAAAVIVIVDLLAAVVIPGVNEALDKGDSERARQQLAALAAALERAAKTLEGYR